MHFKLYEEYPNIRYGITEQRDGSMFRTNDIGLENVNKNNRVLYFKRIGLNINNLVQAKLVHGNNILRVGRQDGGKIPEVADGLITNDREVILGVTAADCFPIYIYDPVNNAVGVAHAGWRGVAKNIVGRVVEAMKKEYSGQAKDLRVGIGPGIRACHFSVLTDTDLEIPAYSKSSRDGTTYVDLPLIIKHQLEDAGIENTHIDDGGECTFCLKDKYFSHRRDQVSPLETMLAYICIE